MLIQVESLLRPQQVAQFAARLQQAEESFVSGKATAGWAAKQVKNNDQSSGPEAQAAMLAAREALLANSVFKSAARPKELLCMLVSRYRPGMSYGSHVDDALMHGKRTDLSFTLFLNGPESYDGGELVIEGNDGDNAIKLAAGSAVVYPTTTLHHVAEVTRGERLVIVGWVRSYIRDAGQREMLFDLDQLVASLQQQQAARQQLNLALKTRNNLLRLWAED